MSSYMGTCMHANIHTYHILGWIHAYIHPNKHRHAHTFGENILFFDIMLYWTPHLNCIDQCVENSIPQLGGNWDQGTAISFSVSEIHDVRAGKTVLSDSMDRPEKNSKFDRMKSETALHARRWQSCPRGSHYSQIRSIFEEHGGYGKWRMWDSEPGHFHDKCYMGQFSIIRWPHCIVCLHQHPTNPVLTTYLGLELGDQLRSLLLAFLFTPCFPFRTPNVKGQFIMSLGRKPQMDREGYHDIMMFARKLKGFFGEETRCFPKGPG